MFPGAVPALDGGLFASSARRASSRIDDAGRYTIALTQNTPTLVHIDGLSWSMKVWILRHPEGPVVLGSGPGRSRPARPGGTSFPRQLRPARPTTPAAIRSPASPSGSAWPWATTPSIGRSPAAASADVAIVVVGTDVLWEAEF